MNLLGMGTDLVELERIHSLLGAHPERFLGRCFRSQDVALAADLDSDTQLKWVAASWATKEALLKALGGDLQRLPYRDIELCRAGAGGLELRLHGVAAEQFEAVGALRSSVDLAFTASEATAVVILES